MADKARVTFTYTPKFDEADPENATGLTERAYQELLMALDHRFGAESIIVEPVDEG